MREKMSGILGGIKANGMIGPRGTKTNGANVSRSSIQYFFNKDRPPKMAIFQ